MIDKSNNIGYHLDSLANHSKNNKGQKSVKDNYQVAKNITEIILKDNARYSNVDLDDQNNEYDCGALTLYHLSVLIDGYLNYGTNTNLIDYLKYKISDEESLKYGIKDIRKRIYSVSSETN